MEAPLRAHPIINPELAVACLRHLVDAWDADDEQALRATLAEARRLLGLAPATRNNDEEDL